MERGGASDLGGTVSDLGGAISDLGGAISDLGEARYPSLGWLCLESQGLGGLQVSSRDLPWGVQLPDSQGNRSGFVAQVGCLAVSRGLTSDAGSLEALGVAQ